MKKFLKALGLSTLGAALFYSMLTVAPLVRAGVSCSVPFVFANGTTADATQVNANFTSLVNCFATTASAGANSDITSLSGLTTPLTPAQGGSQNFWGGTATGTANAVVVTTVAPSSGLSLTQGTRVCFIPNGNNTGDTTLNVNSTGIQSVRRNIQSPGSGGWIASGKLVGGELLNNGNITCVMWGGSSWILERFVDYPGEIKDFGYAGCPTGWAEANAQNVNATNFPDINAALTTTWGTSAGNTVMPDLRGRATFSRDGTGTRLTTDQNGALAGNTVGTTGGLQNQTLTQAQLPNIQTVFNGTNKTLTFGGATKALTVNGTAIPDSAGVLTVAWTNLGAIATTGASHAITALQTTLAGSSGSTAYGIQTHYDSGGSLDQANSITPAGNLTYDAATLNLSNSITPVGTIAWPNIGQAGGTSFLGSGNSHPVTPPLGVVTKCVKL